MYYILNRKFLAIDVTYHAINPYISAVSKAYSVSMFVDVIPNRNSPPCVLIRESRRISLDKVKKTTLANISKLPAEAIE